MAVSEPGPLMHLVADAVPDAILLVDVQGQIAYANPYAHAVFGYESGSLLGRTIEELIPPEFRQQHAEHRRHYGKDPTVREMGKRSQKLLGLRADGSCFPAEIRLSPLLSADRVLAVAVVRDATDHQRIQSELSMARDRANLANEGKSRFLAAVSHDLRQPLQTLRLLIATMQRQEVSSERQVAQRDIDRTLDAASDLVDAVLNVTKLESGTVEPVIRRIAVQRIFEDIRIQLAPLAESKQLHFDVQDAGLFVRTDQVLLRQILQNLAANAIRYTDKGHVILRAAARGEDLVELAVEDTGIGIPESALSTIFQDFKQIARSGQQYRGGVGLGLGTVRRIAGLLGIAVRVESTLGAGSRFVVDVPRAQQADGLDSSLPGAARAAFCASDHTVLVIDDDEAVRDSILLFLEQVEGYAVRSAASVRELGKMLDSFARPPSIIISDYRLGGDLLGTDAVRLVRGTFGPHVPAIILTGDTAFVAREIARDPETVLLNKPVDVSALTALMVEMICASRH